MASSAKRRTQSTLRSKEIKETEALKMTKKNLKSENTSRQFVDGARSENCNGASDIENAAFQKNEAKSAEMSKKSHLTNTGKPVARLQE